MKSIKKIAMLIPLSLIPLLAAACGDARELSATAIVLGMGIDKDESQIELTVELSSADTSDAIVMQARGAAIEDCVRDIQLANYEYLFWGGAAVIVLGNSLDNNDAVLCESYLYRDLGVPGKTPILKGWKCSAADILNGSFGQAPYIAVGLSEAIRLKGRSETAYPLTLVEQLEAYMSQGKQEYAAFVAIDDEGCIRMVELPL